MKHVELERLTRSELSRVRGGGWVYKDGKWYWKPDRVNTPPEKPEGK